MEERADFRASYASDPDAYESAWHSCLGFSRPACRLMRFLREDTRLSSLALSDEEMVLVKKASKAGLLRYRRTGNIYEPLPLPAELTEGA